MIRRFLFIMGLMVLGVAAVAAEPATKLYPFKGTDLEALRKITRAARLETSAELKDAWEIYALLKGSWMPGRKRNEAAVTRLDALKKKLEAAERPQWFLDGMKKPEAIPTEIAGKVDDEVFKRQKETPAAQALKALSLLYLAEHEIDREGASEKAGALLAVLSRSRPWDWELLALHAGVLADAKQYQAAWPEACRSIFLNPQPAVDELQYFAFHGSLAAAEEWPEIQRAIQQAAPDEQTASRAIDGAKTMFGQNAKKFNLDPK